MQPLRQKVCLPFPGEIGWVGSSRAPSTERIPQLSLYSELRSVWGTPTVPAALQEETVTHGSYATVINPEQPI